MSIYVFPTLELIDALKDHVKDPENHQKLLHSIALAHEWKENAKKEAQKHGFFKGVSETNQRD